MKKKVPCKVIRSVSLSDNNLTESSSEINDLIDMHLKPNKSSSGLYIYSEQLCIIEISDDNTSMAQILDSYI